MKGKHGNMRVLYLGKTSIGAPWATRQVRDHVRLGIDAHVAVPLGGPRIAEYEAAGATIHPMQPDFPAKQPWAALARLHAVRELVERLDPDIIHSYYVGTTLTARLALRKRHPIPRVFQVPGLLHLEHAPSRRAEIATAGPHDYWIGVCMPIRDAYVKAGIAPDRAFVSDFGVDLEGFVPPPQGKLRAALGVGPERTLVGMVGIMYPPKRYLMQQHGLKGHEDLIDALEIVQRSFPDVLGVFIGGAWGNATWYEEQVRAYGRAKCGDRVVFLGQRDDVPDLLPDFDIAVQPSHSEGLAGTMKEAQLLRVPVVSTNVGGQSDLIVHGKTGWLVPPKDPPAMAAAILDALRDPEKARRLVAAGYERVTTLFDGARTNAAVVEIYEAILKREGRVHGVSAYRKSAA